MEIEHEYLIIASKASMLAIIFRNQPYILLYATGFFWFDK